MKSLAAICLLCLTPLAQLYGQSQEHWSLRPVIRPQVPNTIKETNEVRNPIDAFILDRLQNEKLNPSTEADRRTLIRRLYFDLLGLPTKPEEVKNFVNDPNSQAYEKLVDRLLASPHFGERFARHWLDIAHYAASQTCMATSSTN